MNVIDCAVSGCLYSFKTEQVISSDVRFVCKNHPRSTQVEAIGRVYDPSDSDDKALSFQESQFDAVLPRGVEYLSDTPDGPSEGTERRDVRRINTRAPQY